MGDVHTKRDVIDAIDDELDRQDAAKKQAAQQAAIDLVGESERAEERKRIADFVLELRRDLSPSHDRGFWDHDRELLRQIAERIRRLG